MASVLATLAALVIIGSLFVLDPGGAIAQSGFPDYRDMGWKQLTVWGFRTIGVGVGLLLVLVLWLKYRRRHGIRPRETHWSWGRSSALGCRRQWCRCWKTGRSATEHCWRR